MTESLYSRVVAPAYYDLDNQMQHVLESEANSIVANDLIGFLRTHRGMPKNPNYWTLRYDSYWEKDTGERAFVVRIDLSQAERLNVTIPVANMESIRYYAPPKESIFKKLKRWISR